MDWDERIEAAHYAESLTWSGKFDKARGAPISAWVSSFRDNRPSKVVGDNCGSFNWCCRVQFENGLEWMVPFAVPGRVMNGDEKVRHEIATMQYVRRQTAIPVPSVIAWGLSRDNPLELGAFIIMEFIEGERLDGILQHPDPESRRTLRSDISKGDLENVYRQLANILLELATLDLPRIGSLSAIPAHDVCIDSGPLTLKMNEIESHGGVRVGGTAPV